MKSHQGAYSKPGKGSVFQLYFPAAVAGETAVTEQRPVPRGRGEHLLYVDDDPALVSLASRMLKRLGYAMTGYTHPQEALQAFRARPQAFDAVITDLAMPVMSGFDLARELLAVRPDLPILLISGYIRPEEQQLAVEIGIRELMLKPNTVKELGSALERLLQDRRGTAGKVSEAP